MKFNYMGIIEGSILKMSKIYGDNGYVDWDYLMEQVESIITVVGSRGVGKTYGVFKKMIKEKKKFISLHQTSFLLLYLK